MTSNAESTICNINQLIIHLSFRLVVYGLFSVKYLDPVLFVKKEVPIEKSWSQEMMFSETLKQRVFSNYSFVPIAEKERYGGGLADFELV